VPKADRSRPPRDLPARLTETAHLARAIPHLPAELLHGVIRQCGLAACSELLTLATRDQLAAVLDLDLWRTARPGTEERLDASRFCEWLEVLADADAAAAADWLARMDAALAIAGLSAQIAVFDPAVLAPPAEHEDIDAPIASALERRLHCEIGGYMVVARQIEWWDAVVAVLVALAEAHPGRFHDVMRGCRRLSNSKPELDGLDELLGDGEQVLFDLAEAREGRRERRGYVTPAQASAFLESSGRMGLGENRPPSADPVFVASVRALGMDASIGPPEIAPKTGSDAPPASDAEASAVAAVVEALLEAGALPHQPRALPGLSPDEAPHAARLRRHMQGVRDRDAMASSVRTQEFAFLVNVMAAACTIQDRPLTSREACDAAAATCNLGLENWPRQWLASSDDASGSGVGPTPLPDDFLVGQDLMTVFQVGWRVLREHVSLYAAARLLDTLTALRSTDREIQFGLLRLRNELTTHWRAGTPWRARQTLDVLAMLDMPAWAALLGLIGELPVLLANVVGAGSSRPRTVDPSAFEFIADNGQIGRVREFMRSLPELLIG
jgi:Family of unknown function (DUF6178)